MIKPMKMLVVDHLRVQVFRDRKQIRHCGGAGGKRPTKTEAIFITLSGPIEFGVPGLGVAATHEGAIILNVN